MKRMLARPVSMTAFDQHPSGAHETVPLGPSGTARLNRRSALDVSIDDELQRGEVRGAELAESLRGTLTILVERELADAEPLTEKSLVATGPIKGLFPAGRRVRRLEALIDMSLARRDGDDVHPTVAGVAAIRRISALPESERPSRALLRMLRQAEIGSIRL